MVEGGCFERGVALRSYKNRSPLAAQYIQSMQQAAVAVGAPRFVVDMRPDPWDVFTANAWTLMPAAVCIWIEKVLVAMLQRDYAGPDAVAIPVPVMPVQAIVELPLPFYVAISRRGTHSIWINQFRVTLIGEDILSRPIRTPPSITDRFPFTVFDHVRMSDRSLRALFWGRLAKVWALVGEEISLRPQPKMAPVEIKGDITEQRLFHHARVVLQAEIMQPQAKHTAVLIPADGSGDLFTAFARVGALTVNAVQLHRFDPARYPGGETITQSPLPTAERLEAAFPGWEFPFVRLADPELFRLIQLPVRAFYKKQIQDDFTGPRLRMLARAFHPRVISNAFGLGDVGKDNMAHIIALVMEDPEWGCQ